MGINNELLQKIDEKYPRLSKGQKKLADYIRQEYDKAAFLTAAKMGEVVGVSESTVVRFAMTLGYKGYPEFQKALEELVRTKLNSIQRMEVTYGRISQGEILTSVLQADIEKIKLTMGSMDQEAFEMAVDTILKAKRIYVIGIRSCAPLASFLSYYLQLICEDVTLVNTNSSSEIFEQLIRINDEYRFIGEWTLSVKVITFAFRLLANSNAFNVRIEYLGKLIPMITSCSLILINCSNISLELFTSTTDTLSQTRFK